MLQAKSPGCSLNYYYIAIVIMQWWNKKIENFV
jgi:hypothetical protein